MPADTTQTLNMAGGLVSMQLEHLDPSQAPEVYVTSEWMDEGVDQEQMAARSSTCTGILFA